jgi:hypothetical protein
VAFKLVMFDLRVKMLKELCGPTRVVAYRVCVRVHKCSSPESCPLAHRTARRIPVLDAVLCYSVQLQPEPAGLADVACTNDTP